MSGQNYDHLPFKLIGMTQDELFAEVERIYDIDEIPSNSESGDDSDVNDINNDIVLSAPECDESDWDADDCIPLKLLICNANMIWNNKHAVVNIPAPFTSDSGVSLHILNQTDHSPCSLFNNFITDAVLNNIVFQTNLYAQQQLLATGKSYVPTNISEIKTFLAINLLMGIKQYPSYRDHWSSAPDLHDPFISKLMTVHRFGWLLSNIHLNDNSIMPQRGHCNYDKLYKVRPFLNSVKQNFNSCLLPHENIAVDESMIKFTGRSSLKQYMPKKPIKRGYKVWVLADQTGYCWDFDIYTGKVGDNVERNLGSRVVKTLSANLVNKNHKMFFDNFFSSPQLMKDLLDKQLYACGTINSNRKHMPKFKDDKELKRGQYEWFSSNDGLTAVKWRDKRCVHLISNYHDPLLTTSVKRNEKDGTSTQVPCPTLLVDYNNNMNFVDVFDQYRTTYCIDRKSRKWWHRIFFFLIDASIVNAYIINKVMGEKTLTMKDFRRQVIDGLIGNTLVRNINTTSTELSIPIKKKKPLQPNCVRLSENAHQPVRTTRRRCAFCSTKKSDNRTNWKCSTCNVPLCLGKMKNCFQKYHI